MATKDRDGRAAAQWGAGQGAQRAGAKALVQQRAAPGGVASQSGAGVYAGALSSRRAESPGSRQHPAGRQYGAPGRGVSYAGSAQQVWGPCARRRTRGELRYRGVCDIGGFTPGGVACGPDREWFSGCTRQGAHAAATPQEGRHIPLQLSLLCQRGGGGAAAAGFCAQTHPVVSLHQHSALAAPRSRRSQHARGR